MLNIGKSPEEWVNQYVLVEITGAVEYQVVARLDGVGDWGVVLAEGEGGETSKFYPWRHVFAMRLAREEDLSTPPGHPVSPSP